MASACWDAETVYCLRPTIKHTVGQLAYALTAIKALWTIPTSRLTLKLQNGTTCKGYGIVISNCRYYGGRRVITPSASLFSKTLSIGLFKNGGRLA